MIPSLRALVRSSSLLGLLALAGCPGTTTTTDDAGTDAHVVGCDGSWCRTPDGGPDAYAIDDAFVPPPDAFASDDTFTAPDAFPTDDAGAVAANAFIARDCGPADGFALRLTISDFLDPSSCGADPLRASTGFYIHDLGGATLPPTAGATITSTSSSSNGSASSCPGGSPPCRASDDWSITFDSYSDTDGASGQFSIRWVDGSTSTGAFVATRCESGPVICG